MAPGPTHIHLDSQVSVSLWALKQQGSGHLSRRPETEALSPLLWQPSLSSPKGQGSPPGAHPLPSSLCVSHLTHHTV